MLMTLSVIRNILFNPIGKIALPESKVVHTIKWFHQVMRHPGEKKVMWDVEPTPSSSQALLSDWWTELQILPKKYKSTGHGYGLLLKQEVQIVPLEEVAINLTPPIGNNFIKVANWLEPCLVKINVNQLNSMHWLVLIRLQISKANLKQYAMC